MQPKKPFWSTKNRVIAINTLISLAVAVAVHLFWPQPVQDTMARKTDINSIRPQAAQSVLGQILTNKTLRCGYSDDAPYIVGDAAAVSGLTARSIIEALKPLDMTVDWVALDADKAVAALQSGEIDAICGGVDNGALMRAGALQTQPLYYSAVGAFARIGDTRFSARLSNGNSSSINVVTTKSPATGDAAHRALPQAKLYVLDDTAAALQALREQRVDLAFVDTVQGETYSRDNAGTVYHLTARYPVDLNAHSIATIDPALATWLNQALGRIHSNGVLDDLIKRADLRGLYRAAQPYDLK